MIWLYILAAAVLLGLVVLLWPGRTPAITDAEGNVIPGSVATLEKVRLNGVDQWVLMRLRPTASTAWSSSGFCRW